MILTPELVRKLFDYDADTGAIRWRSSIFSCSGSTTVVAGDIAGHLEKSGYRRIGISGKYFSAHRVIWLWFFGTNPKGQLDHVNGNRDDNRIINLREADASRNSANRKISTRNTSGLKGAVWHRPKRKWIASIGREGRLHYIGYFDTKEEAHAAYCKVARELFGEFARFS